MNSRFHALRLSAVLTFCLTSAELPAALYSGIYSFGDSLTDVGNTSLASGGASPGAAYFNGRYSNGTVWVEKMAGYLGMPAPANSILGGTNFAFGGAYSSTGGSVPTVTQQVGMFTGGGGTFLATDLITVWTGANDFLLGGQANPNVPVGNVSGIISTLAGAGAKKILLMNMPDLGDTPALLSTGDPASILGASQWSQAFNAALAAQIPTLEANFGIDIIPLNIYQIGKDLQTNPAFTNINQSALLTGNAANADHFLYWDTVHPTAAVHDIFGYNAYLAVIPEPGTTVILFLFGAAAVLGRRRAAA